MGHLSAKRFKLFVLGAPLLLFLLVTHQACTSRGFQSVNARSASSNLAVSSNGFALVGPSQSKSAAAAPQLPTCSMTLADGSSITLINATTNPNCNYLQILVREADASTRTVNEQENVCGLACKGLMKTGDYLYMSDNYLAWFDYTVGDGVNWGTRWSQYGGAGGLSGFWTLNGNGDFKNYKDNNIGGISTHWAPNELIRGSGGNSSNGDAGYWWDGADEGPVGHRIYIKQSDGSFKGYMHHLAQQTNSFWTVGNWWATGQTDANGGTHFQTETRLVGQTGDSYYTEYDNGGYFDSYLDWVCDPTGITVVWQVVPSQTVQIANVFAEAYLAYADPEDNTACDYGGAGNQWPTYEIWWGKPIHAQHNVWALLNTDNNSWTSKSGVGTVNSAWPGSPCNGINHNLNAWAENPGDPVYVDLGFSLHVWGDFSPGGSPNWTFTNLIPWNWTGATGFAPVSKAMVYNVQALWIESSDGTFGVSIMGNGPDATNDIELTGGVGWTTYYRMSTN